MSFSVSLILVDCRFIASISWDKNVSATIKAGGGVLFWEDLKIN